MVAQLKAAGALGHTNGTGVYEDGDFEVLGCLPQNQHASVIFPCGSLRRLKPRGGDLADNLEHAVAPARFDEVTGRA